MRAALTPRQKDVWNAFVRLSALGAPPLMKQIAFECGYPSHGIVIRHLQNFVKRGLLEKINGKYVIKERP